MDFDTRFNEAKKKKERGNVLFRRRDYPQALNLYQTACKIVDRDLGFDYPQEPPEKHQEVLEFRAVILCNTSAAQIKLQLYDAAVLSAREATKLCPSYSKAFYRLGQAYEKKGLTEETTTAYRKALDLHEGDGKIKLSNSEVGVLQSELAKLTEKQKKSTVSEAQSKPEREEQVKMAEKQMYSRMVGNKATLGANNNGVAYSEKHSNKADESSETNGTADDLKDQNSGKQHDPFIKALTQTAANSFIGDVFENASADMNENAFIPAVMCMHADENKTAQQILEIKKQEKDMFAIIARESRQMDPDLLWKLSQKMTANIPHLEEDLKEFKERLVADMREKEAVAMVTTFLMQLGISCRSCDIWQLVMFGHISRQITVLIPDNIRRRIEKVAEEMAKEMNGRYKQSQEMITTEETTMKEKTTISNHEPLHNTDLSFTHKMVSVWEKKIKDSVFPNSVGNTVKDAPRKLNKKRFEKYTIPNAESNIQATELCKSHFKSTDQTIEMKWSELANQKEKNFLQTCDAKDETSYQTKVVKDLTCDLSAYRLQTHLDGTNSDISDLLQDIVDSEDTSSNISDLVDPGDTSTDISDLLAEISDSEDTISACISDLLKDIVAETKATVSPDFLNQGSMDLSEKKINEDDSSLSCVQLEHIVDDTETAAASALKIDDSDIKIIEDNTVNKVFPKDTKDDNDVAAPSNVQNEYSVNNSDNEVVEDNLAIWDNTEDITSFHFQSEGSIDDSKRNVVKQDATTNDDQEENALGSENAALTNRNAADTEATAAYDIQNEGSVEDSESEFFEDATSRCSLLEEAGTAFDLPKEDSLDESSRKVVEEDSAFNGFQDEDSDDDSDSDREIIVGDTITRDFSQVDNGRSVGINSSIEGNLNEVKTSPSASDLHHDGIDGAALAVSLPGDKTSNASHIQEDTVEEEAAVDSCNYKQMVTEKMFVTTMPDPDGNSLKYASTTTADPVITIAQSEESVDPDFGARSTEDTAKSDQDIQHEDVQTKLSSFSANLHSEILKTSLVAVPHDQCLQMAAFVAENEFQKCKNVKCREISDHQNEVIEETISAHSLQEEKNEEKTTSTCVTHSFESKTVMYTTPRLVSTCPREVFENISCTAELKGEVPGDALLPCDTSLDIERESDADYIRSIAANPSILSGLNETPWLWVAVGVGVVAIAGYSIYRYTRK